MDSYSSMSLNFPFLIFFFFCHRELDRDKTFPNHFKYSVHPDSGRERGPRYSYWQGPAGPYWAHCPSGDYQQLLQSCYLHQHFRNMVIHSSNSTASAGSLPVRHPSLTLVSKALQRHTFPGVRTTSGKLSPPENTSRGRGLGLF